MARRVAARSGGGLVLLDSEGLAAAARNDRRAAAVFASAWERGGRVAVSAVTLAEVLRGGRRDAAVHRVLKLLPTLPVTPELGRAAGELLGRTGMGGATVDALVAATALASAGPVLILTSDPDDLERLTAERKDVRVVPV